MHFEKCPICQGRHLEKNCPKRSTGMTFKAGNRPGLPTGKTGPIKASPGLMPQADSPSIK